MIKIKIFKSFIVANFLFSSIVEASFFDENKKGWHWYQNPEFEQIEVPHRINKNIDEKQTATGLVNDYKKELENRLHAAWVDPTFKNIKSYQELQKDMMDRAENFSEMWMRVLYNNPHLDHTLVTPVNHKSRHLYFDQKKQNTTKIIQDFSNEYGLFFFFDSQCHYCQEFAPIVQLFSKLYNWEVIPVTSDGGNLKEFPRPLENNGIINKWNINVFPSLFAVNPNSGDIIPISYGMTSLDDIESRIMLLDKTKGGNK